MGLDLIMDAMTVTETPACLKSGFPENLICLKSGNTEILTSLRSEIKL